MLPRGSSARRAAGSSFITPSAGPGRLIGLDRAAGYETAAAVRRPIAGAATTRVRDASVIGFHTPPRPVLNPGRVAVGGAVPTDASLQVTTVWGANGSTNGKCLTLGWHKRAALDTKAREGSPGRACDSPLRAGAAPTQARPTDSENAPAGPCVRFARAENRVRCSPHARRARPHPPPGRPAPPRARGPHRVSGASSNLGDVLDSEHG